LPSLCVCERERERERECVESKERRAVSVFESVSNVVQGGKGMKQDGA
jgi:hypothetical protein